MFAPLISLDHSISNQAFSESFRCLRNYSHNRVPEFKETKYLFHWMTRKSFISFCNVCFSGFLFDILSVSIKIKVS